MYIYYWYRYSIHYSTYYFSTHEKDYKLYVYYIHTVHYKKIHDNTTSQYTNIILNTLHTHIYKKYITNRINSDAILQKIHKTLW